MGTLGHDESSDVVRRDRAQECKIPPFPDSTVQPDPGMRQSDKGVWSWMINEDRALTPMAK